MKKYESKTGEVRAKVYATLIGKERVEFIEQYARELGVSVLMTCRILLNEAIDHKMKERRTTCEH